MQNPTAESPSTPSRWLAAVSIVLAAFAWFIPTGRIHIDLGFYQFTTGHDIYKMIPLLLIPWIGWRLQIPSRAWPGSPLAASYMAFTGITVLAAVSSINPYQAISESVELLVYLVFMIVLLDLPWRQLRWDWIGGGFLAGNLFLSGETIWTWLSRSKDEVIRVSGSFDHPNALGAYALLGTILLLWMFLLESTWWKRSVILVALILMQLTAMTTASRSGFLAMIVFWILALMISSSGTRPLAMGMLCGWGSAVAMGMVLLRERIMSTGTWEILFDDASRLVIWKGLLFTELPVLSFFGTGMGPLLQERLQSSVVTADGWSPPLTQFGAHNWYLLVFLGTGLIGLLAFLWFVSELYALLKRNPSPAGQVLLVGFLTFLLHHFVLDGWMAGNRTIALMAIIWIAHIQASANPERES